MWLFSCTSVTGVDFNAFGQVQFFFEAPLVVLRGAISGWSTAVMEELLLCTFVHGYLFFAF